MKLDIRLEREYGKEAVKHYESLVARRMPLWIAYAFAARAAERERVSRRKR